jgi:membrane fusion protein (multidrug efflux system)
MTRLNLEALQAKYQAAVRDTAAKQQQVNSDKATYDRMAELVRTNAVTRQQYDDARFKLASDQQALASAAMQAKGLLAKLGGVPDGAVENNPAYKQAQAQVAEAQRELNHATVRAPYDGIVTQVNKLQPGMYLSASTAAFALVSGDHVWVEAQPKETELTWAKPGDHVSVSFDMYPGRSWDGVLESIAPATDQQFSLLPAQNSSGNWVKVVQRVPVRVRVDRKPGDPPLVAGMSATVDIDTGHERSLASLF